MFSVLFISSYVLAGMIRVKAVDDEETVLIRSRLGPPDVSSSACAARTG